MQTGGVHINGAMNKKSSKFSPEVRERAVRLVREQRSEHPSLWAAVESIAPMIGCTPQTLNDWVKRDEIDNGVHAILCRPLQDGPWAGPAQ